MSGLSSVDMPFRLPSDRSLTRNELAWIGFLRLVSNETDPAPTLKHVQLLRRLHVEVTRISGGKDAQRD